jgi:acetate kinase
MAHQDDQNAWQTFLAINCGSSSLKFALYVASQAAAGQVEQRRFSGSFSRIGEPDAAFQVAGGPEVHRHLPVRDHKDALGLLFDWLDEQTGMGPPDGVGHRIVHGGSSYDQPQLITGEVIATLSRLIPLAPLHLPVEIAAIEAVRAHNPSLPQVACFDTAFHRTMPRVAQLYGLPRRFLDGGVVRYGFHGLSYEYILSELTRELGGDVDSVRRQRIVIAHLGSGASMVAVANGQSIDTTMGLTPIGGLVMSTRSGDLDPGVLLYLQDTEKMSSADIRRAVEEQGGLLGVSNRSGDMQALLSEIAVSREVAEAVDLFNYTARKQLGALISTIGGLDTFIFTGGIGEHSIEARQAICEGMSYVGIQLDALRNTSGESIISAPGSAVTVRVIPTNEELMIVRHTSRVLRRSG